MAKDKKQQDEELARLAAELEGAKTALAEAQKDLKAALERANVDGPVFAQGRAEGRSDVAAQLRDLLDPDDTHHWSLDGLFGEVKRMQDEGAVFAMANPRAAELVLAVPARDRLPLLGDLLLLLQPHAGEAGANEMAADILRRKLVEGKEARAKATSARDWAASAEGTIAAQGQQIGKLQAALVARRAPDADAGVILEQIASAVGLANLVEAHALPGLVDNLLRQVMGVRAFLSPQPLVAVAVRDDGTEELAERYTLMVLEWDGKALNTTRYGEASPWSDLKGRLQHLMETRLVPVPFR